MADNLLTRKAGPLPTWGWLAIATGGALLYYLYEKRKTAATAAAATTSTATTAAANVPDYVFQNYNQLPPTAPAPKPKAKGTPAPASTPPPAPTTTPPSTAATPPNVVGMTLAQAIQTITSQGYAVNAVFNAQGQGVNQSLYANSPVQAQGFFAQGVAGQNKSNSYDLQV